MTGQSQVDGVTGDHVPTASRHRHRRPCHQPAFPEREAGAVALASRAQGTSREHCSPPRRRKGKEKHRKSHSRTSFTQPSLCSFVSRSKQQCMLEQNGGPFFVALWPCLSTFDILRIRATAKEFNDAKNYAELFLFLLRNMRCETDPIEPGHVVIESLSIA